MRFFTLFGLLVVVCGGITAQAMYGDDHTDYIQNLSLTNKYRKHILATGTKEIKTYSFSKKHPDGFLRSIEKFDSRGNMTEWIGYNKHGKFKSHSANQYNDSNWVITVVGFTKKGTLKWEQLSTYDKFGNRVQFVYWYKDSTKNAYIAAIQYNSLNNPTELKSYWGKKPSGHTV